MFNSTIYVNEKEVKARLGELEKYSNKVIARAVNRSYITGKNAVTQEAKKDYRVSNKDINGSKTLNVKKASFSEPVATLTYTGEHRNLYLWDNKKAVSPNEIIHWSHGVPNVKIYSAAVERGHGKIKLSGQNKPFVQKVRSGEKSEFVGLFRRASEKRDAKLIGVGAPSIPQILKNDKVIDKFQRAAGPMLQKRLEHEIDAVLRGVTR